MLLTQTRRARLSVAGPVETVICRLYYEARATNGKMTLVQFRRSGFARMIHSLGPNVDLNSASSVHGYWDLTKTSHNRRETVSLISISMFFTANSGRSTTITILSYPKLILQDTVKLR